MRVALVILLMSASAFAEGELGVARRLHDDDGTLVMAQTSYDGAQKRGELDVLGEIHVWGPLELVLGVNVSRDGAKPSGGLGVHVFQHAMAYLRYKAEGFEEPEGEIEATFAYGRPIGDIRLAGDVAYGQDPEGTERDAELGVSAQYEILDAWFAGLAGRYRDALGSMKEPLVRDAVAGAASTWSYGRFALTGVVGVAMVELRDTGRHIGPGATLALGAVF